MEYAPKQFEDLALAQSLIVHVHSTALPTHQPNPCEITKLPTPCKQTGHVEYSHLGRLHEGRAGLFRRSDLVKPLSARILRSAGCFSAQVVHHCKKCDQATPESASLGKLSSAPTISAIIIFGSISV